MTMRDKFENKYPVPAECTFHDGHYLSGTKRGFIYELHWQCWNNAIDTYKNELKPVLYVNEKWETKQNLNVDEDVSLVCHEDNNVTLYAVPNA